MKTMLFQLKTVLNENEDPDMVPKEDPLIVLDRKSAMCMAKNGRDKKTYQMYCKKNAFCKEWREVQDAQNRMV